MVIKNATKQKLRAKNLKYMTQLSNLRALLARIRDLQDPGINKSNCKLRNSNIKKRV